MFDDLLTMKSPPPDRVGFCVGGVEAHLTEGAVMVAYALHVLRTTEATRVSIHPDADHAALFEFRTWLTARGFVRDASVAVADYGGLYRNADGEEIEVGPKTGIEDVSAMAGSRRIVAKIRGGVINTTHSAVMATLQRDLFETVGELLSVELAEGMRQVAVLPKTDPTLHLAERMCARARRAGVDLCLVDGRG